MAEACRRYGVDRDMPQIVAVTKRLGPEVIRPLLEAGHRLFGENKVQEAQDKWPELKAAFPDVRLHLIGPLQSNKARDAVALFDGIESLDREKIARRVAREMAEQARAPTLMVQVNTGEEPQKSGCLPTDLADFLDLCRAELGLNIAGLMCIPPVDDDPALHFALLKTLAERHGVPQVSMGMSADYPLAAALGADYVRIGTALFGARPTA